jgi:bifunctional DNA-binding transcriptional regulator/antitoxin component of YhaV-PrlF toxin-antitoxin module
MQATVQKRGHIALAKSVRDAAKISVGDRVEVECAAPGKVILRRVGQPKMRRPKKPLLNVKPFPRGTLEKAYQDPDADWNSTVSSAIASQCVAKFEE